MVALLLRRLARALLIRPAWILMIVAAPCVALGAIAYTVPKDMSFAGVLDREHEEAARYFDTMKRLDLGGTMFLLLEGDEAKLDEATRALVPVLEALPTIRAVNAEPPVDWLRRRAPYLVDGATFEDWLGLALRPEDEAGARRLAAALQKEVARLGRGTPGVRLVEVVMKEDPLDLAAGGSDFLAIEAATRAALAPYGVGGEYAGLPAIAAQDQSKTLGMVQRLTPISLLLVLLLFRLLERNVLRILLVGAPLVLGAGATLGAVGAITGKITLAESFFGLTIFGLGIDFAILLMARMREERARGGAFDESLARTLAGAGPGILAGAGTTAGAFLIVSQAPDPVALHLGLSGFFGVGACVLLMLTVLPASWVLLERAGRVDRPPPPLRLEVLHRFAGACERRALPTLVVAFLVVAAALAGAPRYRFETDLQKVFNREVPAVRAVERVQEVFGVNGAPWMAVVDSLEEARRVDAAFEAHALFGRADSVADLVPADAADRHGRLVAARADAVAQAKVYRALLPIVSDEERATLERLAEAVEVLAQAADAGPPDPRALPAPVARRLITDDGRYVVYAYTKVPSLDGLKAREERTAAQAIAPGATALGALLEVVMGLERPWLWPVFFAILGFVAIVLVATFRDARACVLALAPVACSVAVTFGAMCWAGVGFNVITAMVVPLVIGLGVDAGIHVVHRLREFPDAAPSTSAAAVGEAILLNTATTCVGFAALLFTDHPGMESMALVMLIGLPACLIASVSVIPALAALLSVGRRA